MTEPDEETKEQPAYPQPALPAEPVQPTTTIDPTPPPPPGMIPPAPGMSPPQPAYQPPAPTYPQPPAAGWPSQPPGQGWQPGAQGYPAQPQGQWQAPGYGAPPGYGPPGYGAAPGWAAAQPWAGPQYGSSVLVALAGVLLIILGIGAVAVGGWGWAFPDFANFLAVHKISVFGTRINHFLAALPTALIVIGVLQLLLGAVILAHRGWARWLGALLALLGLLVSVVALSVVLALVPGVSVQLMLAAVLLLGYAYVLLALIAGGSHFRRRPQTVRPEGWPTP